MFLFIDFLISLTCNLNQTYAAKTMNCWVTTSYITSNISINVTLGDGRFISFTNVTSTVTLNFHKNNLISIPKF